MATIPLSYKSKQSSNTPSTTLGGYWNMKRLTPVPSDLDIAQAAELRPILEVAKDLGLRPDDLALYGT